VPRDTAVKASKKLSARCSSVVWNTRRLLINDWHAVCEAGLLNSQSCTTQQQGQPGQQRPRHVHKRAGRDGHLVARCCRVPSCFCPMCHFGRSIVRVVEGFLCATPRRMHAPAGVCASPATAVSFLLAPISSNFHSDAFDWVIITKQRGSEVRQPIRLPAPSYNPFDGQRHGTYDRDKPNSRCPP
jgi:hypothetical protein